MSTHARQLLGWLSYAFASEVFVVVSLTLFLPICLEQFARDNGFLEPDHVAPCDDVAQARCSVKLGWLWVDTASFSLYVYSVSVALQALTVISMGSIADRPTTRKPLLLAFACAGAIAAILFLFLPSSSPLWLLSALFAVCANVAFGASVVAMNAYLPALARESPEVLAALKTPDDPDESLSTPLLGAPDAAYAAALSRATSRISTQGIAAGYAAGILLLLLALVPVTLSHGSTFSLRLAISLSGLWWLLFSIPAAVWLPAPPAGDSDTWTVASEVRAAWHRLARMLHWSEIQRLSHTFRYLAAWFLLSDGFSSITSTAILFAKTALHMPSSSLVLIGALTPASGILGALLVPAVQRRRAWTTRGTLLALVVAISVVPAYGCLGFLPLGVGGLRTPAEMYVLAVYFGFAYGAFQGYARALYAELIPAGEAARWYALFAITDKSSACVGPLVVGLIADTTGDIRYAFFFLVAVVWAAVPVLAGVDVERGRADAEGYDGGDGVQREA